MEKVFQWKNINIQKNQDKSLILNSSSGEVKSGESLAIMGSSGAGKTTLLNYLSGRSLTSGIKRIDGEVKFCIGEKDLTQNFKSYMGYVTQDDILFEVLTPKELFTFAASVKLTNKFPSEIDKIVENMISELGLEKCKDTRVGNVLNKGLSGGERKRTSIGYELITDPSILFLDEPTTGLDSISAFQVVKIITEEAKKGKIIIFTIHQPRSDIFQLFDKLLLMAQGKTVFFGKADKAIDYFDNLGFSCPSNYNPAEYFIKILSKESMLKDNYGLQSDAEFEEDERVFKTKIDELEKISKTDFQLSDLSNTKKSNQRKITGHNFLFELSILSRRAFLLLFREKLIFLVRVIMLFFNSLLIVIIFWDLGKGPNSVIDRNGCLFYITNSVVNTNMQTNLLVFTKEKNVFYKEQDSQMYRVLSYYLSKTIGEIPFQVISSIILFSIVYFAAGLNTFTDEKYFYFIVTVFLTGYAGSSFAIFLSCLIDQAEIAPAIFPILIFSQTLASGYFVSLKTIPAVLSPFYYISIFRYSYQALTINEFTNLELNCDPNSLKCQSPLNEFDEGLSYSLVALGVIAVINNIISCLALKIKSGLRSRKLN